MTETAWHSEMLVSYCITAWCLIAQKTMTWRIKRSKISCRIECTWYQCR